MSQRATSLGPKPSLFVLVSFLFVFLVFLVGGFKGQVRWPKRPPHLDINPPYLFAVFCFVFFVFLFPFWFLEENSLSPPLKKDFFSVRPFVSP